MVEDVNNNHTNPENNRNNTVLHINAITKLYYIFQLHTFLICKNMANTKTENPCNITKSA